MVECWMNINISLCVQSDMDGIQLRVVFKKSVVSIMKKNVYNNDNTTPVIHSAEESRVNCIIYTCTVDLVGSIDAFSVVLYETTCNY